MKTGNDGTEENPKYLSGVKFELYDNEQCTGQALDTATTNSEGELVFEGLDADYNNGDGTVYWLKEVENCRWIYIVS